MVVEYTSDFLPVLTVLAAKLNYQGKHGAYALYRYRQSISFL